MTNLAGEVFEKFQSLVAALYPEDKRWKMALHLFDDESGHIDNDQEEYWIDFSNFKEAVELIDGWLREVR